MTRLHGLYGLIALALAACNNGSSAPSSGSAAAAATTTAAAAAPTTGAAAAKTPNTNLTNQQLQAAYKAATSDMMATADKQVSIVTAALGKPQKVTGDTSAWYAWKPKDDVDPDCMELRISASKGDSIGGSDWSNCGMAQ
jgi:hypothetical protein